MSKSELKRKAIQREWDDWEKNIVNHWVDPPGGRTALLMLFRTAIRAAYAQGREDAARVCESIPSSLIISQSDVGMIQVCAAAIRSGR